MLKLLARLIRATPYTPGELRIMGMLRELDHRYLSANTRLESIMATLDDILANARAMDTRLDSVRELISSLQQEINDVLSGAKLPKAVQEKIDAIFEQMQKNNLEVTQALQQPGTEIPQAEIDASGQPAPAPVNTAPAPAPENPQS